MQVQEWDCLWAWSWTQGEGGKERNLSSANGKKLTENRLCKRRTRLLLQVENGIVKEDGSAVLMRKVEFVKNG